MCLQTFGHFTPKLEISLIFSIFETIILVRTVNKYLKIFAKNVKVVQITKKKMSGNLAARLLKTLIKYIEIGSLFRCAWSYQLLSLLFINGCV